MPVVSSTQMTLNFEPDKYREFSSLTEFLREAAIPGLYQSRNIPKKHVAADMDLSPSELTRKLSDNPNDPRNFTVADLEKYLATQQDLEPVYYLLTKHGAPEDEEARLAELRSKKARG